MHNNKFEQENLSREIAFLADAFVTAWEFNWQTVRDGACWNVWGAFLDRAADRYHSIRCIVDSLIRYESYFLPVARTMWAREQDRADALHTVRSIMRAYPGDSDRDYEVGHQIDSDLSFGVYGVEFSTAWNQFITCMWNWYNDNK